MNISDVVAALPEFSEQELKTIRGLIDSLLDGSSKEYPAEVVNFYNAFNHQLKLDKLPKLASIHKLDEKYPKFIEECVEIIEFLRESSGKISKAQRFSLYRMCVVLLLSDIRKRNLEVTSFRMIARVKNIPAYVEHAFPGYVPNKLLHMLVS